MIIKPQNELFGNTNNFFFWGSKMQKNPIFSVDYIKKIKFEIVTILLFLACTPSIQFYQKQL